MLAIGKVLPVEIEDMILAGIPRLAGEWEDHDEHT